MLIVLILIFLVYYCYQYSISSEWINLFSKKLKIKKMWNIIFFKDFQTLILEKRWKKEKKKKKRRKSLICY